jgi:hypothetical protein
MRDLDRVKLLFGPYRAPHLRRGDRATCLNHDAVVLITSWTSARISWPLCRPVDCRRGQPTILLNETLAQAVRRESAAAIRYHWGVSAVVVWRWRKLLGVSRTNNEGSSRLIRAAAEQGGVAKASREWTEEEREEQARRNAALGLAWSRWTADDLALLGKLPDQEVARRTGRSKSAVRQQRCFLGIANRFDGRRR